MKVYILLQAKFSVLSISLVDFMVTTELARMDKEKVLNPTGVFPTKHYFHAILTHAILILTLVKQYFLHLMNSSINVSAETCKHEPTPWKFAYVKSKDSTTKS